ncbi:hypothetical protein [Streptomyces marincola]|uniref:Uncharacterized protein n=1 Tax=Streptomyces marincola TaxID=2878388 RepID=A0A1W7D0S7_9ACTN|nr:hypothetical protein [Streptomyces marincola]ARQ70509.1 hypothetical protein CAG99_18155 [Streptomyces marincola]
MSMTSASDSSSGTSRLPQPAGTPEELRAALAVLAPGSLPVFDAERAVALKQARDQVSAAPMRRFVAQWAVQVAIERHPDRSAHLRALEARAAEADDVEEARAIAAEIGGIIDAAATPWRRTGRPARDSG